MSLRVYNTLSKQKEPFEPLQPGRVGIYLCGPTVYKAPHIGHMVGPVIFDAIKRYLTFKGYQVTWVVNITDVDDKIIDRANETKQDWKQVAQIATAQYHDCLKLLGVDTIDVFPKASEHIDEIITVCNQLIASGHAYAAEGNVWFDVTKDADYGKLSNRRLEEQESGTRELAGSGKRNPADFALWKAVKPGEPSWDSPWGKGRPGWHIECTAMAMKYLGETFDMHGGGMDLMFPHHENELAQSECCTGKPFAKYWMHNGLTRIATKAAGGQVKQEKMSKSLGNTLDPVALVNEHGSELVRYLLLSTHYRSPIDFSDAVVQSSKKGLSAFARLFERVERLGVSVGGQISDAGLLKTVDALKAKFFAAMEDDFNTAGAIAALHELAGEINAFIEKSGVEKSKSLETVQSVGGAINALRELAALLGMFRFPLEPAKAGGESSHLVDQLMQLIIQLRANARQKKDFATSDAIRDGLKALNITLEDRAGGTGWRKE